jgi:predicted RNA methylase
VLLELGAGCALPSLAAAASGAFSRVLATDMSADRVAIALRNAELNGLGNVEAYQLDFCELERMDELVGSAPGGCVICAAEVHYDADAMRELISSAASLMRRRSERETHGSPRGEDELILARGAVFAHNDELMASIAREQGLRQVESRSLRAGGLLHAASPTLFEPNPNDYTDLFRFALIEIERDQARGHAAG